ncbi:sulfatase [Compostibacter hankyongensis]|uniref:Sulfatase n=2 Tax=Compostibacter hankyongensis TaxID=1007089 RepID=A0ABP8FJ92_9BACT
MLAITAGYAQQQPAGQRPNVLFICIDDLRPDLGCYGSQQVHSPNLDRFAGSSMLFSKQYATVPTCGASRASILTGMLPREKADLSNEAAAMKISGKPETAEPETFIAQLKRNGYYTVGIGKISHYVDGYVYPYTAPKSDKLELPHSWNEMLFDPGKWKTGWNAFFGYADGSNRQSKKGEIKPYEAADVNDEGYPDGLTAALAVKKLRELGAKKQPFFLAVGFFKPHLPFNAPKKYWDMYDESKITLTPSPGIPENVNRASLHGSAEFNQYKLGEEKASLNAAVSDAYARKLRHAYYACISYTDAQIGKVLDALKAAGLDKNTVVVIWSDHGWHLGDDLVWGKHTIFEWALRSVLMIRTPAMKQGAVCDKVVSAVDVYPTLMSLCDVPMPHRTDGQSLAPLLRNPHARHWNEAAYSYFRNGITVRTARYRLTRYFRKAQPVIELYDHQTDPWENHNVAAQHPDIVKALMKTWEKGNTGIYDKRQQ